MLIIAGHLEVDVNDRDSYASDCQSVVERARNAPGCLDFAITADSLDRGRVNVYERWEDDGSLTQFRGSGPDDELSDRIRSAEVRMYRISTTEDP